MSKHCLRKKQGKRGERMKATEHKEQPNKETFVTKSQIGGKKISGINQ